MLRLERVRITAKEILLAFCLLFCHALFLRNHQMAVSAVAAGLRLAAGVVLPSLFPFFVLSHILVESDAERILFALPCRFFSWNPAALSALFLASLCGAPVGARLLTTACESGKLTKEEAGRLLPLVGVPSLPFVVGTVGGIFFGSVKIGLLLWLSILPGTLLCALILRGKDKHRSDFALSSPPVPRFATLLTNGVASAAKDSLLVSAYVVFFSALFAALDCLLAALSPPPAFSAFLCSALEVSGGLQRAATLARNVALPIAGFAAGFGGLSIYFQVLSLTDGGGISSRAYLPCRALIGLFAALLFPLLCHWFGI